LSYLLIEINKLPISTTGIFFPLQDPEGNKIQKADKKQLGFVYNAIPLNSRTCIIISTVKTLNNNLHKEFLLKIKNLQDNKFINYFLTYSFYNNDNIVLNPDWFNALNNQFKDCLNKLMNHQVGHYGTLSKGTKLIDFCSTLGDLETKKTLHI